MEKRLYTAGPGNDSALSDTSTSKRRGQNSGARSEATTVENSPADATSGTTVEKAIATASAVGSWVLESGERQGKLLLRKGRDWLDGRSRRDEQISNVGYEERSGEFERRAPEEAVAKEPRQEERLADNAPHRVRNNITSDMGAGSSVGSHKERSAGGAWRRGRLDEDDKQS